MSELDIDDDYIEWPEEDEDRSEELRDLLLHYTDTDVLRALMKSTIIDQDTGSLTDYWMNLLSPDLAKKLSQQKNQDHITQQEEVVLSALAKLLQKHIK